MVAFIWVCCRVVRKILGYISVADMFGQFPEIRFSLTISLWLWHSSKPRWTLEKLWDKTVGGHQISHTPSAFSPSVSSLETIHKTSTYREVSFSEQCWISLSLHGCEPCPSLSVPYKSQVCVPGSLTMPYLFSVIIMAHFPHLCTFRIQSLPLGPPKPISTIWSHWSE